MTAIGDLRDVVVIQAPAAGQDNIGEPLAASWSAFATVRACVRDLTGRELIAAQSVQSQVTTKITIRYRADLLPSMRVTRGTDIYQIQNVMNPSGRKDWTELLCIRGLPDA
jgi:SPP1 family predicted phage head-tail adaptor